MKYYETPSRTTEQNMTVSVQLCHFTHLQAQKASEMSTQILKVHKYCLFFG